MILYRIIRPSHQMFRDISPPIPQKFMRQEQNPLLFLAPLIFLNIRIQMIMPSFSALFPDPPLKML